MKQRPMGWGGWLTWGFFLASGLLVLGTFLAAYVRNGPKGGPLTVRRSEVVSYTPGASSALIRCSMCNGTGRRQRSIFAHQLEPCEFCEGKGIQRVWLEGRGLRILSD